MINIHVDVSEKIKLKKMIDNRFVDRKMTYTAETAYEAMKNGAKNEAGDPVYDWLHLDQHNDQETNMKKMKKYIRSKHFDQFVYDYKIWDKCKHVILPDPTDDDDSDDSDVDEDGEKINWVKVHVYHMLFSSPWYQNKTSLQLIVDNLFETKEQVINDDDFDDLTYIIYRYDMLMALIKEWIKQSQIATKADLIQQLPLDVDCNQVIQDLYKHILS